jgi:hypothetical protein
VEGRVSGAEGCTVTTLERSETGLECSGICFQQVTVHTCPELSGFTAERYA